MLMELYKCKQVVEMRGKSATQHKPMWEKFPLSFERFLLFVFISIFVVVVYVQ